MYVYSRMRFDKVSNIYAIIELTDKSYSFLVRALEPVQLSITRMHIHAPPYTNTHTHTYTRVCIHLQAHVKRFAYTCTLICRVSLALLFAFRGYVCVCVCDTCSVTTRTHTCLRYLSINGPFRITNDEIACEQYTHYAYTLHTHSLSP